MCGDELLADQVDLLPISPERFGQRRVCWQYVAAHLPHVPGYWSSTRQVHCISDWGHDFRTGPESMGALGRCWRGFRSIFQCWPPRPLRTDVTEQDAAAQLGGAVVVQRGPLVRESLAL